MVWDGRNLPQNEDWIFKLSERDLCEIQSAVKNTKLSAKPVGDLTREDFDFKELGRRLETLRDDVLRGRGFVVIRGLPASLWDDETLIRAYWGIGAWLGDPVSQNAKGHLLGHVIDQRLNPSSEIRIYRTNQAQPFHSDSCDIVGLLCLREAKSGGASAIASSPAVHNRLLVEDRDALDVLYGEFQCDRYGEIPKGQDPHYCVHVFNDIDGEFVCCGMDPDIRSAQRLDNVKPLSKAQLHALDVFQKAARELSLRMTLKPGDVQFLNNHTIVHARDSFEDYTELHRRRYLVRLWLSSPRGRPLPKFLIKRWGNIKVGTVRGGIIVPGVTPAVHLDPDQ